MISATRKGEREKSVGGGRGEKGKKKYKTGGGGLIQTGSDVWRLWGGKTPKGGGSMEKRPGRGSENRGEKRKTKGSNRYREPVFQKMLRGGVKWVCVF